jgi:hypothetical protein
MLTWSFVDGEMVDQVVPGWRGALSLESLAPENGHRFRLCMHIMSIIGRECQSDNRKPEHRHLRS